MLSISSSDVIRKPSYVTQPKEITMVKDAKQNTIKSIIFPYELYKNIRERLENELYLVQNADALSRKSYEAFLAIDEAGAEDLG